MFPHIPKEIWHVHLLSIQKVQKIPNISCWASSPCWFKGMSSATQNLFTFFFDKCFPPRCESKTLGILNYLYTQPMLII